MSQEHEYQKRLEEQREFDRENKEKLDANRKKTSLRKLAGNVAKEAGISNAGSLMSFVELRDVFFAIAVMSSLLKDIVDPIGGFFVIFGFMASIVTAAAMLICGANPFSHHSKERKLAELVINKWGVLVAGTIFESFFIGFNFLPIQTVITFIIFLFILKERKRRFSERQAQETRLANSYAQEVS